MSRFEQNWPSNYTYFGRYEDLGITDRVIQYAKKTEKTNLKILDVGCSVGLAGKSLKVNLSNHSIKAEITGIDVNSNVRHHAEEYLDRFNNIDILNFTSSEFYDVIICSRMVIVAVGEKRARIIAKCASLLVPDGALITDVHTYQLKQPVQEIDWKKIMRIMRQVRNGLHAIYKEFNLMMDESYKSHIFLIEGKENVLNYSNRILDGWNKFPNMIKWWIRIDFLLSYYMTQINSKPNYKKQAQSDVIKRWWLNG